MEEKKTISTIIIMIFIVISCTAQEISKEVNKFEKFQNRLKKGNSTLGMNINLIQYYETGNAFGYFANPSIEYSYFLVNRFSLNTCLGFKQNFYSYYGNNDRPFISQKFIDLQFRYYFFKRGGFFISLGGSFGHILVDRVDEFCRKFYAAPKIDIGYSYMITNVWKPIDNKTSLNILISSYIPLKRQSNFDVCDMELPYFPFFSIEIGVVYYFLRKK
jgi:hypothetical protein